jgi:transcriptional regulator with GAF, ATPase, and Fis domain
MADALVTVECLSEEIRSIRSGPLLPVTPQMDLKQVLELYEKQTIERTLKELDFNYSEAARRLGLTRQALQYKARKYGL